MKYLLIMQMNPEAWDALTEKERNAVMSGHGEFIRTIKESGEMVSTDALAGPAESVVVRGTGGGAQVVSDGPYAEAKEFMGGFYVVDCASKDRAVELARLIPDTRFEGLAVEIRPILG